MDEQTLNSLSADVAALKVEADAREAKRLAVEAKNAAPKMIEIPRSALTTRNYDVKALREGRAIVVDDKPQPAATKTPEAKTWNNDKGYWVQS